MKTTNHSKYPSYTFSSFTEEKVRLAFQLKFQIEPTTVFIDWINHAAQQVIEETEQTQLDRLQRKLMLFVRGWNEQELRERFIIPVIELVDFDLYDLEVVSFAEREMEVVYQEKIIKGKVEWMVATGITEPRQPFFFVHEYKKEKEAANDPLGQLLATLFAAQQLNQQKTVVNLFHPVQNAKFADLPLYGSYVLGRFWFFVCLEGRNVYVSKAYDSTGREDLQFILKLLKAQKERIIALVSE